MPPARSLPPPCRYPEIVDSCAQQAHEVAEGETYCDNLYIGGCKGADGCNGGKGQRRTRCFPARPASPPPALACPPSVPSPRPQPHHPCLHAPVVAGRGARLGAGAVHGGKAEGRAAGGGGGVAGVSHEHMRLGQARGAGADQLPPACPSLNKHTHAHTHRWRCTWTVWLA